MSNNLKKALFQSKLEKYQAEQKARNDAQKALEFQQKILGQAGSKLILPVEGWNLPGWLEKQPVTNDGSPAMTRLPIQLSALMLFQEKKDPELCLPLLKAWAERCNPPRVWDDVLTQIQPIIDAADQYHSEEKARREERSKLWQAQQEQIARSADEARAVVLAKQFDIHSALELADTVSKELTSDPADRWLIEGLLARDQFAIVGGAQKNLKTTILLNAFIAIGAGKPFLGFKVPKPKPVLFLSAESGRVAILDTASRICDSMGLTLDSCGVRFGFQLPKLDDDKNLNTFFALLKHWEIKALAFDPLYLALGEAADPANLFAMGELLARLAKTCLDIGCTPIVVHHARKSLAPGETMQLSDLAGAGVAEFARQWWLLSRRKPYNPEAIGDHHLIMNFGGSAGHSGIVALDVREGSLLAGAKRSWQISHSTLDEARCRDGAEKRQARSSRAVSKVQEYAETVLQALGDLGATEQKGIKRKAVQGQTGLNGANLGKAINMLRDQGRLSVEEVIESGRKTHILYLLTPSQGQSDP